MNYFAERKLDELGRIVIPMQIRRKLGIEIKENLGVYLEGNRIIIEVRNLACKICGREENINSVFQICTECRTQIKES